MSFFVAGLLAGHLVPSELFLQLFPVVSLPFDNMLHLQVVSRAFPE